MPSFLISLLVASLAAPFAYAFLRRRRRPQRPDPAAVARRNLERRQSLLGDTPHEYRLLSPDHLPDADLYFYDHTRDLLQSHGFSPLGDIENTTLTRVAPPLRSFTRALASADGSVAAAARQNKSARRPATPDTYSLEFQTEFTDGSFLLTNNTGRTAGPVQRNEPGLTAFALPRQTPPEELLRFHLDALAGKRAGNPSLTPVPVRSADDFIHLSQRLRTHVARVHQANNFAKPDPQKVAARQILNQQQSVYRPEPHEIRLVPSPVTDFPNLDHTFYDRTRDALAAEGFRFLHDEENLTLTRIFPHYRSYIRVLLDPPGTTLAGLYHVRNLTPEARCVELESELSDGSFLITTTARDVAPPVPGLDKRHLPAATPPADLVRIHRERLAQTLAANPALRPTPLHTSQDTHDLQARLHTLKSTHAHATGLVTPQLLQKIRGRSLTPQEQILLSEIQKLQDPAP